MFLRLLFLILLGLPIDVWLGTITRPNKKTKKILILGMKGAGKTTLWNKLREINSIPRETSISPIKSFPLKRIDGSEITIESTKDIGGDNVYVSDNYEELIQKDSFIYFLFDIRKIEQDKKAIKARMMKIWSHISKHNIENVSMQLVATHFDEYVKVLGGTECAARSEALRTLELKSLFDKLQKKKKIEMSDDFLMVGSLLDDKFVESIKDCIIKSSE